MAEQLALILYRRDGGWRMRVDVGEPGREHARAMNRQDFEVHGATAAAVAAGAGVGVSEYDPELAHAIRQFFEEGDGG